MRRFSAAVVALAGAATSLSGPAAAALTPSNSIVVPRQALGSIDIEGIGCGLPASATVTLPAGAFDIRAEQPAVGTRSRDALLTAVAVQGVAITFTAVADGAPVCDPAASEAPPESRSWFARFDTEVDFRQRIGVLFLDRWRAGCCKARPRVVPVSLAGNVRGLRWQRFGGRKAVGFGRWKSDPESLPPSCRQGGCATEDGTRLRVELTRPSFCSADSNVIFYARVALVLRQQLGVLRPGTEWVSWKIECGGGGPPTPIR